MKPAKATKKVENGIKNLALYGPIWYCPSGFKLITQLNISSVR